MGWAVKAGLVKGDGQELMPKATASRAQAAAILHRCAAVVDVYKRQMEFYYRLASAGIIVAAAAGNEYSAAYKNLWGTDLGSFP